MIYFYFMPVYFRAALASFLLFSGGISVVNFMVTLFRRFKPVKRIAAVINASVSLVLCFITGIMGSIYLQSFGEGMIFTEFFEVVRYSLAAISIVACVLMCIADKKAYWSITCVPPVLMNPVLENQVGEDYPYIVLIAAVMMAVTDTIISVINVKKLRSEISVLSIKTAIDKLPVGVMLCEPDGRPRLINNSMMDYADALGGTLANGGTAFWKYVIFGDLPKGAVRSMIGDTPVIEFDDGRAFNITRDIIKIGKKRCFQLTASDFSDRWKINSDLQEQKKILRERSAELNEMIKNVGDVCRERELISARGRVHDILGQRITIFQRYINSGVMPPKSVVANLVSDLSLRLREERQSPPSKRLKDLTDIFESVDVKIITDGNMPGDKRVSECFFRVIREAATNSVRHGFASEVYVTLQNGRNSYSLTVTDNGTVSDGEIRYGTGIKEMRRRVTMLGGVFEVSMKPEFEIRAYIPKTN